VKTSPSKEQVISAYQIIRQQPPWSFERSGFSHHRVLPFATYAPWLDCDKFQDVFSKIKDATLVDIYRCYELWELAHHSLKLGGDFLEVGVWRGGTGALLTSVMEQKLGAREEVGIVYLADTFRGVVKADDGFDPVYRGGEHSDTSVAQVQSLMGRLGLTRYQILPGIFPDETSQLIKNPSETGAQFSLCHIDVDVYQSARDVFLWVHPRLQIGGCIVFDDYGFSGCEGVTRLCNELKSLPGYAWCHNLNGHFVVTKITNENLE
jgi:O-methyltransferase